MIKSEMKSTMNAETKVVCPVCGAEFAIPEHEHIAIDIAIGKDSGLGTISPTLAENTISSENINTKINKSNKEMKAAAKIEALKKAGVNVNNLFAMKDMAGNDMVGRLENGMIVPVADNDSIFSAIQKGGTVPNRRLFRRWVMAQMFHMMTETEWGSSVPMGFINALRKKGYEYQWKVAVEELRVQAKLFDEGDTENYGERNRWFNRTVVIRMAEDYMGALEKHIENLLKKPRRCKGVPYIKLGKMNIFVSDIAKKVTEVMTHKLVNVCNAKNPGRLHWATFDFYRTASGFLMNNRMEQSKYFQDAYKGAGAYFTMKNLVLFHNCRLRSENGCFLSTQKSLAKLEQKAHEYQNGGGWMLFGMMKECLKINNIDIEKKIAEWRK